MSILMAKRCLAYLALASTCHWVQAAQPPGGNSSPTATGPMSGYTMPLANADREKLRSKLNEAERAKLRAQAIKESGALVQAMHLACDITDAELIGRGTARVEDKSVEVSAYEVACSNRAGYFLESQGQRTPIALSCFAVDAGHAADVAQGKQSDSVCKLDPNKDVRATAAAWLSQAGAPCAVKTVQWFGLSTSSQTEYIETACVDGSGYLLKIARTDAATGVSAFSCVEAAKRGWRCRLTDGGPVSAPLTLQTYRDALKQHAAACDPTLMRVIGRESEDQRYVVEMRCSERRQGMVAFIPLEGNTKEFELIDCAAAAEREIRCELQAPQSP